MQELSSISIERYHVGRHVANLQVVNTYEGTYLARCYFELLLMRLRLVGTYVSIFPLTYVDSHLK
jgi:hypothetical protein